MEMFTKISRIDILKNNCEQKMNKVCLFFDKM